MPRIARFKSWALAIALLGAAADVSAQQRLSVNWPRSDNLEAQALIDEGDGLLTSPYLPEDVRPHVESKRLGEATTLSSK